MKRRRKRFVLTGTVLDGRQIEVTILAYQAHNRGDVVRLSRTGRVTVQSCVPARAERVESTLDERAVRAAMRELDIKLPVYIRRTSGEKRIGLHRLRTGGNRTGVCVRVGGVNTPSSTLWHAITVSSRVSAQEASQALWHELAHAMQKERDMGPEMDTGRALARHVAEKRVPYKLRPCELEARSYEPRGITDPLIK